MPGRWPAPPLPLPEGSLRAGKRRLLSSVASSADVREGRVMAAKYDTIGVNYSELRRPDSRIARIIETALGSARTVLNVGAGTGSYEPRGRLVTAVEPSGEMIRKRSPAAAEAIQASAEDLPFDDKR